MDPDKDAVVRPPGGDLPLFEAHPAMVRNRPLLFIGCLALPTWGLLSGDDESRRQGAALAVLAAVVLLVWWLRCLTTTLMITGRRVVLRRGILAKELDEVFLEDIHNIRIHQGPLQRLLGVGSIRISSSEPADARIQVRGIPHPDQVLELINRMRS